MNIEKDKKLLSFIMVTTGILIFIVVIGIVIFSLPDTKGQADDGTHESTVRAESTIEIVMDEFHTKGEDKGLETAGVPASPVSLRIVAYGDNLLHKGISDYSYTAGGYYDFTGIYSDIKPLNSLADIIVVNEEVPIGGAELGISGYPNFNAPYEACDALSLAGVNVLTLATNHILDVGAAGLVNTLTYVRNVHPDMLTTGAYLSAQEREVIPVMEKKGVKTAFLNYTYGLNGHSSTQVVVNMIDDELMTGDIKRARELADIVVVCMHWGDENVLTPTDEQRRLARLLCEAGADLVLGSHPHVTQPVEVLTSQTGRKTVVYYSLGNLVSLQHQTANMLGGVADVTFTMGEDGISRIDNSYSFVVTQWDDSHAGTHIYPWESYTRELAQVHGIRQFDASFSYDALNSIISQVK